MHSPDMEITSGILPWTRSCFVCGENNPHGLHLKSRIEEGRVVLDYTTREADRGYRQMVHGGIVGTLLDEVMTWAAILFVRKACVAAEFTTRLKTPVEVGQRLRVEGETETGRSRLVLTTGRALDANGNVVATASGKYVPMPPAQADLCEKDFVASPDAINPGLLLGKDAGHGRSQQVR
jgi:acyl-coenzyme A thioesterase PaaI-like protein